MTTPSQPGGDPAPPLEDKEQAHPAPSTPAPPTLEDKVPPGPPPGLETEAYPPAIGRYRVVKKLGQGGMGAVYLARDTQLDRLVAVKVPHFGPVRDAELLERFHREARAAAMLHHPNICPVFDVGESDGIPYLTMAYIEGQTLAELAGPFKNRPPREAGS
jgi:serine/threonine protein kinase